MKFELVKTKRGDWFFRIIAKNGRTICHSENYKRKTDAWKAINLIATQAEGAFVKEIN